VGERGKLAEKPEKNRWEAKKNPINKIETRDPVAQKFSTIRI